MLFLIDSYLESECRHQGSLGTRLERLHSFVQCERCSNALYDYGSSGVPDEGRKTLI